jgi:hypothetical protein
MGCAGWFDVFSPKKNCCHLDFLKGMTDSKKASSVFFLVERTRNVGDLERFSCTCKHNSTAAMCVHVLLVQNGFRNEADLGEFTSEDGSVTTRRSSVVYPRVTEGEEADHNNSVGRVFAPLGSFDASGKFHATFAVQSPYHGGIALVTGV